MLITRSARVRFLKILVDLFIKMRHTPFMKITKCRTKFSRKYTVDLREERLGEITISSQRELGDNSNPVWKLPAINWASCGGQEIPDAQLFVRALDIAISLASVINSTMPESERVEYVLKLGHGVHDSEIEYNAHLD